jgi:hypothetical protein
VNTKVQITYMELSVLASQASCWIAKYLYKLAKVLIIKPFYWCCTKGKKIYKKLRILTIWCIRKLQELIIRITPYYQSFIASSSNWPILGLLLPNCMLKSTHVDKATQACSWNTRRPSHLSLHKPVDTCLTFWSMDVWLRIQLFFWGNHVKLRALEL